MILAAGEIAHAVLLLQNNRVMREFLYSEFEALLDGYIPLPDYADELTPACYVEIDSRLCVRAAIFFLLPFDSKGFVSNDWKLPLLQLARLRTAHYAACPAIPRLLCADNAGDVALEESLWTPDFSPTGPVPAILAAVSANRLCIQIRADANPPPVAAVATAEAEHGHQQVEQQLADATREVAALTARVAELEATNSALAAKNAGLRDYFSQKVERAGRDAEGELAVELETAQTERDQLIERLKLKEIELSYWLEHEGQLLAEIDRLKALEMRLSQQSGSALLEALARTGVSLVTYQPGAGHITVPAGDVTLFLENPTAFTAAYCGVSEQHYLAWLRHYQTPVCEAMEDGCICSADVNRISSPVNFELGESALCDRHLRQRRAERFKLVRG